MNDNVVKFRRIEKKPEPPVRKKFKLSGWLAWTLLILIACAIVAIQKSGMLAG